jgi:hypothetical protein
MSNSTKRIWVVFSGGDGYEEEIWLSPPDPSVPEEHRGTEYIRSDLAPVIGYTERQVRTAMTMFSDTDHTMEEILATLTPTAQLRDPKVLVEALERIEMICYENIGVEKEIETVACEALAEWKGGLSE